MSSDKREVVTLAEQVRAVELAIVEDGSDPRQITRDEIRAILATLRQSAAHDAAVAGLTRERDLESKRAEDIDCRRAVAVHRAETAEARISQLETERGRLIEERDHALALCKDTMYVPFGDHSKALARISQLELELQRANDAAEKGEKARAAAGGMQLEIAELSEHISELEREKTAANGLREGHALVVRQLEQRIAQLEQSPEIIAQLEDEKRVMGERITALEAGIRKWASECAECGGKGFTLSHGGYPDGDCAACADIRALVPNILPNLPASVEG